MRSQSLAIFPPRGADLDVKSKYGPALREGVVSHKNAIAFAIARSADPVARPHKRAMGPNDDGADDQPIADMLRTIEPARPAVGDGEAAADGAARLHAAPLGAATPPVSKGKKRKVGASGYRGVAFHQVSGKYRARITSSTGDGRQRALGYFATKEDAARAWDVAARCLGWAEECMNFPIPGSFPPGIGNAPPASPAPPAFGDHDSDPDRARHARGPARGPAPNESDRGAAAARMGGGGFGLPGDDSRRFARPTGPHGGPPGSPFPAQSVVASSMPELHADGADMTSRRPGALPPDRRRHAGNGTGCKGVRCKGNGMYEARIKMRDRPSRTSLGLFKTALEAMLAYDDAARSAGYCLSLIHI